NIIRHATNATQRGRLSREIRPLDRIGKVITETPCRVPAGGECSRLKDVEKQPALATRRGRSLPNERIERDEEDLVRLYLTDIGQYPLLTKDDEVRLAKA